MVSSLVSKSFLPPSFERTKPERDSHSSPVFQDSVAIRPAASEAAFSTPTFAALRSASLGQTTSVKDSERNSAQTGVAVHHLSSPESEQLQTLLASFPDTSVVRIINEHFVETALRTGTDKGDIVKRDVRRLTGEGGYDVWGVEDNLAEKGLTKADVFCGTPKELFQNDKYNSASLGLPSDRSAILVFDGNALSPIDDTDGYRFNDPANKKAALLGVITFDKQLLPFEHELASSPTAADRTTILEREVRQGLQTQEDVKARGDLLSVLITNTLYDVPEGEGMDRLVSLAKEFKQRSFLIDNWGELQSQLESATKVPDNEIPQRQTRRLRQPAFVAKQAQAFLASHPDMPVEFLNRFQRLIAEAGHLVKEFAKASA